MIGETVMVHKRSIVPQLSACAHTITARLIIVRHPLPPARCVITQQDCSSQQPPPIQSRKVENFRLVGLALAGVLPPLAVSAARLECVSQS